MRTVAKSEARRSRPPSRRVRVAVALVVALVTGGPAAADDSPARGVTAPAGAGMRVYRDPTTGEFIAPPAEPSPPTSARAFTSSAEGLAERPGTSPAGGVMIDLRGQFQSAVSAVADDGGRVRTDCHAADAPR